LTGKRWYERPRTPKKLWSREDWREWQANTFASELLMPGESVMEAFEELIGVDRLVVENGTNVYQRADEAARAVSVDDLGIPISLVERFDVNPQAMAIRLVSLGLVVEKEKA